MHISSRADSSGSIQRLSKEESNDTILSGVRSELSGGTESVVSAFATEFSKNLTGSTSSSRDSILPNGSVLIASQTLKGKTGGSLVVGRAGDVKERPRDKDAEDGCPGTPISVRYPTIEGILANITCVHHILLDRGRA